MSQLTPELYKALNLFTQDLLVWVQKNIRQTPSFRPVLISFQKVSNELGRALVESDTLKLADERELGGLAPSVAFEIRTDDNVYRIYADGRVEGFGDKKLLVLNRIPRLVGEMAEAREDLGFRKSASSPDKTTS